MDDFSARYRAVARIVAWVAICGIVVLTVIPANDRPTFAEWWLAERLSHFLEHFSAFGLVGAAFAAGYYRLSLQQLVLLAFVFSAGIELLQIPLPTRHARLSDFIIDFATLCIAAVLVRATIGGNDEQRA
jgi:VanZ family protein